MNHSHRRANSEMPACIRPVGTARRQWKQPQNVRCLGLPVPATPGVALDYQQRYFSTTEFVQGCHLHEADSLDKEDCCAVDINTHLHFRSQSSEIPHSRNSYAAAGTLIGGVAGLGRYDRVGHQVAACQSMPSTPLTSSTMPRRSSESSTNSTSTDKSIGVAVVDGGTCWSRSTTPDTMSPTSPSNTTLPQSPDKRTPSPSDLVAAATALSPSKPHEACMPVRPARPRTGSRPTLKCFKATPIESSVLEEEEQAEMRHSGRAVQHQAREQPGISDDISASALHRRRQRRQQRLPTQPQAMQPVRPRLSLLPPLPLRNQALRTSSAPAAQRLKNSSSQPQLRVAAGSPSLELLPPLPTPTEVLPSFSTPVSPALLTAVHSMNMGARSSPPNISPPASPTDVHIAVPALSPSTDVLRTSQISAATMERSRQESKKQLDKKGNEQESNGAAWEAELRRHRWFLHQFPQQAEEEPDRPKPSRGHRSLENLRARSRSLTRATANLHGEATAALRGFCAESHTSSLRLRGPRSARPSTARSMHDSGSNLNRPRSPLPQPVTPHVSVFEEDSDNEGDPVRKFVRNLFNRRTRSAEVPAGNHGADSGVYEMPPGAKVARGQTATGDANGHNSRTRNCSTSSAFSVATTLGTHPLLSATLSAATVSTKVPDNGCETDLHLDVGISPSSAASPDQSRTYQRGALLGRMFVRRSH